MTAATLSPVPKPLVSALTRTLERGGWEILGVDIDMTRETARIELRRGETFVTFDARNGKATTTRERQEIRQERYGRKGDICMVGRIHMHFIGRAHHEGARSGLRWLTNYIADNSTGALSASEVRLMLAPMMETR